MRVATGERFTDRAHLLAVAAFGRTAACAEDQQTTGHPMNELRLHAYPFASRLEATFGRAVDEPARVRHLVEAGHDAVRRSEHLDSAGAAHPPECARRAHI